MNQQPLNIITAFRSGQGGYQNRTIIDVMCRETIDSQLLSFSASGLTMISMINPEKIWTLIARKMAGEPLGEDLKELEEWVSNDKELESFLAIIISSWQPGRYNKKEVQFAFRKVAAKLAVLNKKGGGRHEKPKARAGLLDFLTRVKRLSF